MIPELFLNDLCRRKSSGVMATVLHSNGHGPAKAGDRLFFSEGRLLTGTVGGGSNEQMVLQACATLTGKKRLLDISPVFSGPLPSCGGTLQLLLERVDPGDPATISFWETLQQLVPGPLPLCLLSRVDEKDQPPCSLLAGEKGVLAALPPNNGTLEIPTAIRQQLMTLEQCCLQELLIDSGPCSLFVQPLNRNGRLFLLGAGHVAREVAWLAERTGFQVIIVDPRQELMQSDHFPKACTLYQKPADLFFSQEAIGPRDFLVIAGPDHATDLDVLLEASSTPARYIGVIGSQRKIASFEKVLRTKGLQQSLEGRLHAPIGIPISSKGPAEVAVSIVAELIQIRANPATRLSPITTGTIGFPLKPTTGKAREAKTKE